MLTLSTAKACHPRPGDPGELEFLPLDPVKRRASRAGTRVAYTRDGAGAQRGEPAHYMLRWPALTPRVQLRRDRLACQGPERAARP